MCTFAGEKETRAMLESCYYNGKIEAGCDEAGRGCFHVHRCHGHPLPDEPLRERGRHKDLPLYAYENRKGG